MEAHHQCPARGQLHRWRRLGRLPRYLAVASGTAEPCPGNPAPAPRCWTGLALYNPTANRWTVLAVPGQFDGLAMGAVVWTGADLIVGAVAP